MSDIEESKKHHAKGAKIKITKTMHKVNKGSTHTVHSLHYGVYYGVRSAGQGITYVPHQHTEPCNNTPTPPPSDPPPSDPPPSGGNSGGSASDLSKMTTESWLDYVSWLLM